MPDLSTLLISINQDLPLLAYFALFFIILANSGLFIGFLIPGDSILVITGLLATQGIFSLPILLLTIPLSSIIGYWFGYIFGKKFGKKIFPKNKSVLFNKKHLERAHSFYKKHGAITIILARFIPIVRTFAPIIAGIADMNYKKFFVFNILGGIFWTYSMLLFGYFLGNSIPNIDKYLLAIIAIIILVSLIPTAIETYIHKRR